MTTLDQTDARSLISNFDAAQSAFLQAFSAVPDAALAYRPEGDDYAFRALSSTVAGVSVQDGKVVVELVRPAFGPVNTAGPPHPHFLPFVRDGTPPAARASPLARVQSGHARLTQGVQTLSP